MKLLMAMFALALVPNAAFSLTCKDLEDAGLEDVSDYFEELKDDNLSEGKFKSALLRKSVAAFHGDLAEGTTDEEANEQGEGVGFALVKGKDGVTYQLVNVGFGGGNSATYYYKEGTLDLASIMSNDGDCLDQGTTPELPFEQGVQNPVSYKLTCSYADGSAPFQKLEAAVRLTPEGAFFETTGKLKFSEPKELVKGVAVNLPKNAKSVAFAPAFQEKTKAWGAASHTSLNGKKDQTTWTANVRVAFVGKNAKVSGRLYPNIAGGYWNEDAKEYKSTFDCDSELSIKSVKYYRVIKY